MRLTLALIALAVATPALAQTKPAAAKVDEDKIVCKREVETGSLVRAKKTCMTRRDWKIQMLQTQEEMRQATLPINTNAPQ